MWEDGIVLVVVRTLPSMMVVSLFSQQFGSQRVARSTRKRISHAQLHEPVLTLQLLRTIIISLYMQALHVSGI
jgi:hypothetical protein